MANRGNYFIEKNNKTNEIVYIEYEKIDGYVITPKTKKEDAIDVTKIVFVSPTLSEKIIKKKIDHQIAKLLNDLRTFDEDSDNADDGAVRKSLMDAEKLKLMILNNYVKYLGNTYGSLTLKKVQIIINQLRLNLYNYRDKEINKYIMNYDELNNNRGRGR